MNILNDDPDHEDVIFPRILNKFFYYFLPDIRSLYYVSSELKWFRQKWWGCNEERIRPYEYDGPVRVAVVSLSFGEWPAYEAVTFIG